jgi:hypothetical protein
MTSKTQRDLLGPFTSGANHVPHRHPEALVMLIPVTATPAPSRAVDATGTVERSCGTGVEASAVGAPSVAALFPPRDADADTRRAWVASSPWPEIVFASAH